MEISANGIPPMLPRTEATFAEKAKTKHTDLHPIVAVLMAALNEFNGHTSPRRMALTDPDTVTHPYTSAFNMLNSLLRVEFVLNTKESAMGPYDFPLLIPFNYINAVSVDNHVSSITSRWTPRVPSEEPVQVRSRGLSWLDIRLVCSLGVSESL
jgi:hypothetical protein